MIHLRLFLAQLLLLFYIAYIHPDRIIQVVVIAVGMILLVGLHYNNDEDGENSRYGDMYA